MRITGLLLTRLKPESALAALAQPCNKVGLPLVRLVLILAVGHFVDCKRRDWSGLHFYPFSC